MGASPIIRWSEGRRWGAATLASAAALFLLLFPGNMSSGGYLWQSAGGAAHVVLCAGLAWLWERALSVRLRGLFLWGVLAAFSGCVECLQPLMGRSAEWADWLYGAGGAACICGTWRGQGRFRIRWIGVLALCLFPLTWEIAMVRMEIHSFPVLADPGATWSRRGWILNGIRFSAGTGKVFRIETSIESGTVAAGPNPGLFRAAACSDWSRMAAFHAKIYWPASTPAVFAVRVDDRPGNPPYAERFQREFSVTQGWNAVCIPAEELGRTSGGRPMQLEAIRHWGVFLVSATPFDYFLLGQVRLDLHQEPP